jgi:hypothetical protein
MRALQGGERQGLPIAVPEPDMHAAVAVSIAADPEIVESMVSRPSPAIPPKERSGRIDQRLDGTCETELADIDAGAETQLQTEPFACCEFWQVGQLGENGPANGLGGADVVRRGGIAPFLIGDDEA